MKKDNIERKLLDFEYQIRDLRNDVDEINRKLREAGIYWLDYPELGSMFVRPPLEITVRLGQRIKALADHLKVDFKSERAVPEREILVKREG